MTNHNISQKIAKSCLLVAAALLLQNSCFANDGAVGLDSGNIVFKKSDGVTMRSEDLYISPKTIWVRYEFQNVTANDITTFVGFQFPLFHSMTTETKALT